MQKDAIRHSIPKAFGAPVGDDQNFKPDEARTTKDFAPKSL